MTADERMDLSKDQAIRMLLSELEKGRRSIENGDVISEEDVVKEFSI